ncbi:MAG TPA: Xaa-Pro peptidase family protein [Gemmataceae bacterium]|nr:Xaa-Pro peptidase family protein [Gemmataceae bacterium]
MDYPAQRREKLMHALRQEGLDALLVSSPVNVTYLTGFSGESSYLILAPQRTILVSDFRFVEQIAEECPDLEAHIRPPSQALPLAVAEVLDKLGFRSIGFESGHLNVAEYEILREKTPSLDWKGGRDRVEQLRAIKDPSEVAQIREAIAIAERAFAAFRSLLRPTDSEKDLADALEGYVRRAGGWGTSFPSIVAVGDRAALPHAPPTARTVGEGELLLVDWGASGRFYKSDLTRVLAPRRISTKLEEVYTVVLRAQERAIQRIRPGVKAHDVDAEARAVIAEAGFGDSFGHGVGHGLGLQVHEAPFMRPTSETVLQAGMVMTVEPGIYLPGWGGVRIEDDVLVTPDGCEVLTHVARDLASIAIFDW